MQVSGGGTPNLSRVTQPFVDLQYPHPVVFVHVAQSVIVLQSIAGHDPEDVMSIGGGGGGLPPDPLDPPVPPDPLGGLTRERHVLESADHPHLILPAQSLQFVSELQSASGHSCARVTNVFAEQSPPISVNHFGIIL